MSDLRDLYQEVIVDHGRRPRNFRKLDPATHHAEGYNPLCGDRLEVYVSVEDDRVADVSFEGSGCAISQASASLMTETLKGKTLAEAMDVFHALHAVVTGRSEQPTESTEKPPVKLGKLAVLEGVREYPMRVKCATLAWHTFHNALKSTGDGVAKTE